MSSEINTIMGADQIRKKIRRIAYEIYEHNFKEKNIVFAGITGQGFQLAGLLADELTSISEIETTLIEVILDKDSPHYEDVELSSDIKNLVKYPVILVDDVLNTGKTLMYSLRPFLELNTKKIEVAVLVDRGHALFPVSSTYRGVALSTTLNEHIQVILNGDKSEVCLT